MKVTIDITDQRITDLLHGHSGQYSPWLHAMTGSWKGKKGCSVRFDAEDGEEGEGKGRMKFGRKAVARGLALMAQHSPSHFGDFVNEDDDAITFDVAIHKAAKAKWTAAIAHLRAARTPVLGRRPQVRPRSCTHKPSSKNSMERRLPPNEQNRSYANLRIRRHHKGRSRGNGGAFAPVDRAGFPHNANRA